MTSLQLGLIAAGILLVVGVLIYNWLQERRVRRRIREAFTPRDGAATAATATAAGARVEPTLSPSAPVPENARRAELVAADDSGYEPPLDVQARIASEVAAKTSRRPCRYSQSRTAAQPASGMRRSPIRRSSASSACNRRGRSRPARLAAACTRDGAASPLVRPARAGPAVATAQVRHGRRILGNRRVPAAREPLGRGDGAALAGVRAGRLRIRGDAARGGDAPDIAAETARAEALDRICADLDVQIGVTLLKTDGAMIAARGCAAWRKLGLSPRERRTLRLDPGRHRIGALRTAELPLGSLHGGHAARDVDARRRLSARRAAGPRAGRVFDQMKIAAKRMAHSLDAVLVDDNRRPLDDAAFAAIREQVRSTTAALREVNIEPGSPRALALFGG
jgi:FtsZ-interacting cell division protein ZipA